MKINNTTIISPSDMKVTIERIGSSVETMNGRIVSDTFGYRRVLECAWSGLYASEMSTLLTALSNSQVNINYFDPEAGNTVTKVFLVSDKTIPAYTLRQGKEMWSELSVTFTEVV